MNIGDIIKQRRKELNLTLEEVGKKVGVGKSTVKKWESGYIANMKRDKIALLAEALQINPSVLIDTDAEFKAPVSDSDLRIALFDGDKDVTPEMWEEVKNYAKYVLQNREKYKFGNNKKIMYT